MTEEELKSIETWAHSGVELGTATPSDRGFLALRAENKQLQKARDKWRVKFQELQQELRDNRITAEDLAVTIGPADPESGSLES